MILSLLFALLFGSSASNVTLAPHGPPVHKLFVFLPGTGAKASKYMRILTEAQNHGYAVVGLNYENRGTVNMMCAMTRDPRCWGNVRGPRADSAVRNLTAQLEQLGSSNSSVWGEFYSGGAIAWDKIVLSGHSQGAGEAVWIAKEHRVAHVCGFDSPSDGNRRVPVAAWLSNPSATPASSIVIATNSDDEISKFAFVRSNVAALGLPSANFIVETIPGHGFLGSHNAIVSDPNMAAVRARACFS